MKTFQTILVTGTTSGLGRSLLKLYCEQGGRVISVNRSENVDLVAEFPSANFQVLDITDLAAVRELLETLRRQSSVPDLFVLNAGINLPDNVETFDHASFKTVMETNLFGVMTFISAIHTLGFQNRVIAAISSMSNIIPNPGHLAYSLSKWSLHWLFRMMKSQDGLRNEYKAVVLGPIRTNIMRNYPAPTGLQCKILEQLLVPSHVAARACMKMFSGEKRLLHYPVRSWIFYSIVKWILRFWPSLYRGTERVRSESVSGSLPSSLRTAKR